MPTTRHLRCCYDKGEEKKSTTVSILTPLFQRITERTRGTGFTSVSSLVNCVLGEGVAENPENPEVPVDTKSETPEKNA